MNWKETQLVYHALARRNEECLILTSTREPYACIGFAQDMRKELDLDYCRENGIGYFRRETGGGTVYLDKNQLFYQVIIRRDNPLTPRLTQVFFGKFLKPVIGALHGFGIEARFVPINDLIVGKRKISGNGGGEIGECKVLIGNLLLDFDYETMAAILNVPNEEFRNRILKSMKQNMTTIRDRLGQVPPIDEIRKALVTEYEKLVGPLEPSELDEDTLGLMEELDTKLATEEWLFQRVPKSPGRDVKIREGVMVVNRTFSYDDWEIDMNLELVEDVIKDVDVMGTTNFKVPTERIKATMFGTNFAEKEVLNTLNDLHGT
jgi:lipoate-protein ligase A